MKQNHYLIKRLARVQQGLHLTDDKATVKFHTLFGVPNLQRAITRVRATGATSVVFVPADGGPLRLATCDQTKKVTPGIALAFEAQEPAAIVAHRPLMLCSEAQLRQMATLDL